MREAIDLASERLRGYVLQSSDQSLGHHSHLLKTEEPQLAASGKGCCGRASDAWETHRAPEGGHEWAVIRLGVPGLVEELVIDTTGVAGNSPQRASVEGCVAPHNALHSELDGWVEILPQTPLVGGSRHSFPMPSSQRFSHLRLRIFPDGAVARFRVMGRPMPGWMAPGRAPTTVDLALAGNGASLVSCSDEHFGAASNLLQPGCSRGSGWQTRRRREPGQEWAVVRLAGPGRISSVVLDTVGYHANCPTRASLEAACSVGEPGEGDWFELMSAQTLVPHTEHHFSDELQDHHEVRWMRLRLYPDGGVARLRLWGELSKSGLAACRLAYLNACGELELHEIFRAVCHSNKWATELSQAAPYESLADLQKKGASAWSRCREADWKESLAGHPRIGERAAGKDLASKWSRGEQSKAAAPDQAVKDELRARQVDYEEKFGFIFLICATGRSSAEILASLNERMEQSPERELQTVAEELAKIIHLRLEKLLEQ